MGNFWWAELAMTPCVFCVLCCALCVLCVVRCVCCWCAMCWCVGVGVGVDSPSHLSPHLSPCVRSKRLPCVHSKRLRVYRHHARNWYHMRAWCRYTRRRFELNVHTEVFSVPHHTARTHHDHNDTHQHNTASHTTTHGDRDRDRDRERRQRKRDERREKREDERGNE